MYSECLDTYTLNGSGALRLRACDHGSICLVRLAALILTRSLARGGSGLLRRAPLTKSGVERRA
eukprot:1498354-Pleurochrysis_carterae.AAC.1